MSLEENVSLFNILQDSHKYNFVIFYQEGFYNTCRISADDSKVFAQLDINKAQSLNKF